MATVAVSSGTKCEGQCNREGSSPTLWPETSGERLLFTGPEGLSQFFISVNYYNDVLVIADA